MFIIVFGIEEGPKGAQCDFCSSTGDGTIVRYRCPSFLVESTPGFPPIETRRDWNACLDCTVLIEREDWTGLFGRTWAYYRGARVFEDEREESFAEDLIRRVTASFRDLRIHQ